MMARSCRTTVGVCLVTWLLLSARASVHTTSTTAPPSPVLNLTATTGTLAISEFRVRGANSLNDEYIEIANISGSAHTVVAVSGTGYGIAASDGVTRCSIPNGTVIPNHGHYLCVNSIGYSLASYPAGGGTTAVGDASYTNEIPDNWGIALFNNNTGGAGYSFANRIDAAGSTSEANSLYKEGTGYPALIGNSLDHAFYRRWRGACVDGTCGGLFLQAPPAASSELLDSNDNANDFIFVETTGSDIGAGKRLGAPGPQNLSSPIMLDGGSPAALHVARLDGCTARTAAPNRIRTVIPDAAHNSTFGTLDFRTTWTNNTGADITRLRFRIVDISATPVAPGTADLRPRTSTDVIVNVDRAPCGSTFTASVTVKGTTLEQPAPQAIGGGFNASLSAGTVTAATPLANAASIDLRFLVGIEQTGLGRFCVMPETLPASVGDAFCMLGTTETPPLPAIGDFDNDQHADLPMYNPSTGQWNIAKSSGTYYFSPIAVSWGGPGYTPQPGDYDGDGRYDLVVYENATGVWSILMSTTDYTRGFYVPWGGPGYRPVGGDYDGDGTMDIAVYQPTSGMWFVKTSSSGFAAAKSFSWGGPGYTPVPNRDFDGDHTSDVVVYRERTGTWSVLRSDASFTTAFNVNLGGVGFTLVPGDYDEDGKDDFAVYRRSTGLWQILTSSSGYVSSFSVNSGGPGFLPVPGDYDGDGVMDIATFQPETNGWVMLRSVQSNTSAINATFGPAGSNPISAAIVPAGTNEIHAGDFDGDMSSDLTVYNTTGGGWSTLKSSAAFTTATTTGWGGSGYSAAPGDYDGDGKADLGLYQGSTGTWLVLLSSSNFTTTLIKGAGGAGYVSVPGDYDGDGKTDPVVYNTTTGLWYGLKSSTNYTATISVGWGGTGYIAAPGDFDADGKQDLALYQASTGNWLILKSSSNYTTSITRNFGGAGYAPVPADFDGDAITDFAVYQPATGVWTMLKSSTGNTIGFTVSYGGAGYTPVAGDWDGDGRADAGVYQPSTGNWSILLSSGAYTTSVSKNWGGVGYAPVPHFP